jgi:GTP:adenosylcobinamide-phosphate guanylyltransferase
MKIDAVVLAGGEANRVHESLSGPKSLISVAGRPMISYVMDALKDCAGLDNIVISIPPDADPAPFRAYSDRIVTSGSGVVDAVTAAIEALGVEGSILVASSDTPMISRAAVESFLESCRRAPADIHYSIVPQTAIEAVFPGTKRTYMRLKDGVFTGGNIHLADKETFIRNRDIGNQLFELRKNPLGILRLLGTLFMVKYLTGRLEISALESKAGDLLNAQVRAVVTSYPELGVDVDKPEDLELAETHMAGFQGR